ncbi:hypothetical protein DSECCO2_655630 [anaerobic digester metagenome]
MKQEIEDRYESAKIASAKILGWDEFYEEQKNGELHNDWNFQKRKLIAKVIVIAFSVTLLYGLIIGLYNLVV